MTKKDLFKLLQENLTLEVKTKNIPISTKYPNYCKTQNYLVIMFDSMEVAKTIIEK